MRSRWVRNCALCNINKIWSFHPVILCKHAKRQLSWFTETCAFRLARQVCQQQRLQRKTKALALRTTTTSMMASGTWNTSNSSCDSNPVANFFLASVFFLQDVYQSCCQGGCPQLWRCAKAINSSDISETVSVSINCGFRKELFITFKWYIVLLKSSKLNQLLELWKRVDAAVQTVYTVHVTWWQLR